MLDRVEIVTIVGYMIIALLIGYAILYLFMRIPYSKFIRQVLHEAARMMITYSVPKDRLYESNGHTLRNDIQWRIRTKEEYLQKMYENETHELETYLYNKKLIDQNLITRRIRYFKLAEAVWNYDDYGRGELMSSMRSSAETLGLPPEQIMEVRKHIQGDQVGVYIIYNMTKKQYYVGQAKKLYHRVWQHFTGHGNGDVYADYKYGDKFMVRLLTLQASGYSDLDQLERDMIRQFNAFTTGYNKTVGNGYHPRRAWSESPEQTAFYAPVNDTENTIPQVAQRI